MTPDVMAGLRVYVESLPPGTAVPVARESLLELLSTNVDKPEAASPDFTVAQVAAKYGRSASTVRGWILRGLITGTYKFQGKEVRIPPASLAEFERKQHPSETPRIASPSRTNGPIDLAEYKHAS